MKYRTLNDVMTPVAPASLEEWKTLREKIVANLKFASSCDLLKQDAPLNAQVFDPIEYDEFVVEKVIFQSLPGYYVTGNLYRPKDTTKKYPAVLNPHGHWDHGRLETKDLARIPQRCANLAMRGIVAFIYDMVGYNDAKQIEHHVANPEYEKWNYGQFALQTNNSLKAVDFVASLPYVDAERIGCTGCSGGGTQTYFLTALDERIKAAAPINMASTIMQGGCICENAAFLRTEFCNIDYTMTAAPRPLFMSGSDGDWTVNSETVEFPAVEKIYALYGAEGNYEHFYQSAPHCYNLPVRERVYRFFCKHFGIDDPFDGEIDLEMDTEALKIGDLRKYVPAEGYVEGSDALFELSKSIIRKNLSALNGQQCADILRRVFLLDKEYTLDIPYEFASDGTCLLGECPKDEIPEGVQYVSCYNESADAKRVSALIRLMQSQPDAVFTASGKTAALCRIAAKLAGNILLTLTDPDEGGVMIPGSALADEILA